MVSALPLDRQRSGVDSLRRMSFSLPTGRHPHTLRPVPDLVRDLDEVRRVFDIAQEAHRTNSAIQSKVVCGHLAGETADDADEKSKVCLEMIAS